MNYEGKREKNDDGEEVRKPTSEDKINKLCLQEICFRIIIDGLWEFPETFGMRISVGEVKIFVEIHKL